MVAIVHLEKYVNDRPDQFPSAEGLLTLARRLSQENDDNLYSGEASDLLGIDHFNELCRLIVSDAEYIALSVGMAITAAEMQEE
jgi:hypothetical protein